MKNKSQFISKGGLLTGVSVVFLYLCFFLPTNKLGFLVLASSTVILSIKIINFKGAILVYVATGILSFILGLKSISLAYISLFGLYPFIKYKIEGLRNIPLEILSKLLFLNLALYINYSLYKTLFAGVNIVDKFPLALVVVFFQFLFLIFDYVLTLIIQFVREKFKGL